MKVLASSTEIMEGAADKNADISTAANENEVRSTIFRFLIYLRSTVVLSNVLIFHLNDSK